MSRDLDTYPEHVAAETRHDTHPPANPLVADPRRGGALWFVLIAARVLQGGLGGMMVPQVLH